MKAVLDACVLYPTVLREILADCAAAGLYRPLWSQRILDEWRLAAARHDLPAGVEIALLTERFPAALVAPGDDLAAPELPDPADRHVAATALAGGAALIVTANLRDFPRHALAPLGLRAIHPDAFLCDLHLAHPGPVQAALAATEARAARAGAALSRRDLLRRARLPRLGKAVERATQDGPLQGQG